MIVHPKRARDKTLDRGAACLQCRRQKIKCDGLKPTCSRCYRLVKKCAYSSTVQHHPVAEALGARTMELELVTHKLAMASKHSLLFLSKKLEYRIGRLGVSPKPGVLSEDLSTEDSAAPRLGEEIIGDQITMEDLSNIQRIAEKELSLYDLEELEALPPALSNRL
ncbi:hypothetical protein DL93DRAFT_723726 [Clavulina sp. PMI_390]|nr:hypothetical protein DL93DRAFT_723726 [Clavulina sp. PMI_390]